MDFLAKVLGFGKDLAEVLGIYPNEQKTRERGQILPNNGLVAGSTPSMIQRGTGSFQPVSNALNQTANSIGATKSYMDNPTFNLGSQKLAVKGTPMESIMGNAMLASRVPLGHSPQYEALSQHIVTLRNRLREATSKTVIKQLEKAIKAAEAQLARYK